MTAVLPPKPAVGTATPWNSMPGWGLAANLLPPEVIASRRMRVLRRWMIVALIAVVVLSVAAYVYAIGQRSDAQHALNAEQDRTSALKAEQRKYADVVRMQGTVAAVQGQIAGLMRTDVDLSALLTRIGAIAPGGVSISQLTVTLTSPAQAASQGAADGVGTLDTSGEHHIGTITLVGSAPSLTSVAAYVDALRALPGMLEVFPTSQTRQGATVQYNLSITLGASMQSHRYDAKVVR